MAITATFKADFSSFTDAVNKAEVELKSFESGAGKVGASLTKMANSLTGTKIIQDATLMAEAVERVGGVTKLTERELQKLGATANEAVAKMTKLGMDIPPGIQKIADASNTATTAAFNWRSALTSVAGVMGVAFSVGAIKNFALSVIETAGNIGDMAVKLGVSAEAIQRWGYAAEQSGTTIDVVEKSIAFMNKTLAEGNKSTVAALDAAALSFQEIRRMSPEQAFNAITDAVGKIEDPMVRAKVATELFGRAGQDMLPAMIAGFKKVGDETRVMSDATVARLKEAEDAWKRLSNTATVASGSIIASGFKVADSLSRFFQAVTFPSEKRSMWDAFFDTTEQVNASLAKLPPVAMAAAAGIKPLTMSAADTEATIKHMNIALGNSALALNLIEPKVGSLDKAIKGFKENNEAMNLSLRFTSEVVGELPPKFEKVTESVNKVAAAIKTMNQIQSASVAAGDTTNEQRRGGWAGVITPPPIFSPPTSPFPGTGAGTASSTTVNVNGILMGSDPAALEQLTQMINASVAQAVRGSGGVRG